MLPTRYAGKKRIEALRAVLGPAPPFMSEPGDPPQGSAWPGILLVKGSNSTR
jgi:hypothetical protein